MMLALNVMGALVLGGSYAQVQPVHQSSLHPTPSPAPSLTVLQPVLAIAVIDLPLLRVRQHLRARDSTAGGAQKLGGPGPPAHSCAASLLAGFAPPALTSYASLTSLNFFSASALLSAFLSCTATIARSFGKAEGERAGGAHQPSPAVPKLRNVQAPHRVVLHGQLAIGCAGRGGVGSRRASAPCRRRRTLPAAAAAPAPCARPLKRTPPQPPPTLLQLVVVGGLGDAQRGIVIPLCHGCCCCCSIAERSGS